MSIQSSTGGQIIFTKTGLIHKENTERFEFEPEIKKNGRPSKDDDSLSFDFSALMPVVSIPAWTGPRQVFSF
jgi:hypothetical protein